MLKLIIINLIVITNSTILAKKFFKVKDSSEYFLTGFVLFFAQIVLSELFLGIIGQLYFYNLLLLNFLILSVTLIIYRKESISLLIKVPIEPVINSKLLVFALSVFSAFFLIKVYFNLINPPFSPDSLQYHLAFPATWIRSAKLDNPFVIFGGLFSQGQRALEDSGISYFPINAELFFTWLMLPLRNGFLADLGEAPFYFVGIAAVYSILKKYGVNRRIALLSGFLWAIIPNIFKQLSTASQNDVICAVLLLLVIYTLLLIKEEFSFKNALLFGISVGLFVGTKILNIIWLIALIPLISYLLYRSGKINNFGFKKALILFSSITLMVILFGGISYIKNFIFTGNPIFPSQLQIFGKTVFKGLMDKATYNVAYALGDRLDLRRIAFSEGLGVQFLALILPCIFLPLLRLRFLMKNVRPFTEYILLFITPLAMFLVFRFFVNVYVVRYLYPLLSIGLVTAVIFLMKLPRGENYLFCISFISIFASAAELAHRHQLVASLLLSLLFFIVLFHYRQQIIAFYNSRVFTKALLVVSVLALTLLAYFNEKYNKEEFKRYSLTFTRSEAWQADIGKSWQWLNQQTKEGARVAYTGRQEFYPLFGSGLKNDVKYVSINEKEAIPYNQPDGLCRVRKNFQAWRENLKKEKIEYLFIALPFARNRETEDPTKFPIEDDWASKHPRDFKLLFKNSLSRIYLVKIIN